MKRHDLFTWEGEGKSMKRMHRTILGLVASVVMVGALALFGCGDGGGGGLETCSADNLKGRVFTFTDNTVFKLGTVIVTIGPTGTDFTLTAGGKTATGTISYSPFKLTVTSSTFAAGTFPAVGTSFTATACTLDTDNNTLTLTDLTGTTGTGGS
jgi:hypothetical protein